MEKMKVVASGLRIIIYLLVNSLILLCLIGCPAKLPVMSQAYKMQVLQSQPPANMSYIYIVRPFYYRSGPALQEIRLDNDVVGKLATGTFFVIEVPPGNHTIQVDPIIGADKPIFKTVVELSSAIRLNCQPGSIYYFDLDTDKNLFGVVQVTEDVGRKLLLEAEMLASSKILLR